MIWDGMSELLMVQASEHFNDTRGLIPPPSQGATPRVENRSRQAPIAATIPAYTQQWYQVRKPHLITHLKCPLLENPVFDLEWPAGDLLLVFVF